MQQSLDFQQGGNGVVVGGPLPGISRVTLPETNIAPENEWLEDDPFLLGNVSFREGIYTNSTYRGERNPRKTLFLAI